MRLLRRDSLTTLLCLLTLYVVWGSTYLAIRFAVVSFAPLQMASVRFLLAGGLLYGLLRARGTPSPSKVEWRSCAAIGLPMMGVGLGGASLAMTHVSSGMTALVFGSAPVWTAVFERASGVRLRGREGFGMVIGLSGLVLVATRGELRADPIAAIGLAGSAATYAFGCFLSRRLPQPRGSMSAAAQMVSAGVALALASLLRGEGLPVHVSWLSVIALVHLVLLGSMLAYTAFNHLLRTVSVALATSTAFVNPVVALGLGALAGGEHVGRTEIVAAILVVAGVITVASAAWRPRASRQVEDEHLAVVDPLHPNGGLVRQSRRVSRRELAPVHADLAARHVHPRMAARRNRPLR